MLEIHIRLVSRMAGPRFLILRRQLVQSSVSRKPVHLKTFLLILVMVIAGPLGNVLLGKGMKQAGSHAIWPPTEALHTALRVFATGSIWLGVGSLLAFFLANVLVLSWADYSYVQPASSVGYGVSALLGYFMLSEPVSPLRWLGIAIICLGVLVVGQTNPRSLERSPTDGAELVD